MAQTMEFGSAERSDQCSNTWLCRRGRRTGSIKIACDRSTVIETVAQKARARCSRLRETESEHHGQLVGRNGCLVAQKKDS